MAFVLGLMTAISPCPMATNITAVGYLSKDITDRGRVFRNGIVYTFGRAISYTAIGLIFFLGAGQFGISSFLQSWGEKLLGPLLLIIGLFMLGLIPINLPVSGRLAAHLESRQFTRFWDVLLMGMVFALAFCPYSGVLYFGMLIPMTVADASGLYLPVVFALATGIPVIVFAWLIAYSIGRISAVYNKLKLVERWFRRVVGGLFVVVGLYYLAVLWF